MTTYSTYIVIRVENTGDVLRQISVQNSLDVISNINYGQVKCILVTLLYIHISYYRACNLNPKNKLCRRRNYSIYVLITAILHHRHLFARCQCCISFLLSCKVFLLKPYRKCRRFCKSEVYITNLPQHSQSLKLKSLGARADHSLMVFTVLFM